VNDRQTDRQTEKNEVLGLINRVVTRMPRLAKIGENLIVCILVKY
jgi:hypothetical protein